MKVCVYGAGAIGGHLAAKLARAGHDVSVVVRDTAYEAIVAKGITLVTKDDSFDANVRATTVTSGSTMANAGYIDNATCWTQKKGGAC